MIKYFKKIKISKFKEGMTYVELIVVLSIFAIMSGVIIFDYGRFQAKINVKNLANDIALQIVQAQKDAISGKWQNSAGSTWKPAYGAYFDTSADNKRFTYFTDLNNNNSYANVSCSGECLENITITKGNFISGLVVTGTGSCSGITSLTVVFTRPDSSARMSTNQGGCTSISYGEITISSPSSQVTSKIKIYSSGRIQIN